ncbi:MAG: protein-glutamate O-methyltransferase [Rhodopseudomonas sp.]|uniref:CheR family methyltransferase n=1 Tax=Rhodopseudomonas sp. TaxID=1078 RepID=UPI0017D9DDD5|nr:protein-glutamate O-methyltransferase [Rhodopseudomonas sp.]NVN84906.1 protein-glutamate O-methyltransferase [Rhodopseudomonas sp.]
MEQDYALQDGDFRKIAKLVMDKTGIVLSEKKRAFIHGRLGRRLRMLGLSDFSQYCRLLESRDGEDERHMLVNAVTTNHTSFFREEHHFDYLTKTVLPTIATEHGNKPGRLRIWSAGCSTGEEPHTIAMTLREFRPSLADWDARILATDLDTNVVGHAAAGVYDADRLETIPAPFRKRYVTVENDGRFRINDEVRSLISFAPLNLLEKWPMSGPFDVIFCRNVVIYFDKPTQRKLFDRYAELLRPDGWLFIGHSESLLNVTNRFSLVGRTIYRRTS